MLLRDFKHDDLRTLHAIDVACFPPGVSYSLKELEAFITHRHSKAWVAVQGEKIVGFLVAQRVAARVTHIITIDVIKESRHLGVGSALIDAAEEWARVCGSRLVSLETAEDNDAALTFYEERGYKKLKLIRNYYDDSTAAWVMAKPVR